MSRADFRTSSAASTAGGKVFAACSPRRVQVLFRATGKTHRGIAPNVQMPSRRLLRASALRSAGDQRPSIALDVKSRSDLA